MDVPSNVVVVVVVVVVVMEDEGAAAGARCAGGRPECRRRHLHGNNIFLGK